VRLFRIATHVSARVTHVRAAGGEVYSLERQAADPAVVAVKCWQCGATVAIYAAARGDVARERRTYLIRAVLTAAVTLALVLLVAWAFRDGNGTLGTFLLIGGLVTAWLTLANIGHAALSQECGVVEEASPNTEIFHEAEFGYS
jgi:putative copper export protein